MTSKKTRTEDDREIHDIVHELSFITFCETIIEEIETQGKFYEEDIEESRGGRIFR